MCVYIYIYMHSFSKTADFSFGRFTPARNFILGLQRHRRKLRPPGGGLGYRRKQHCNQIKTNKNGFNMVKNGLIGLKTFYRIWKPFFAV